LAYSVKRQLNATWHKAWQEVCRAERHALRDDQWEKSKDALPGKPEDPSRTGKDNRLFIEAVMWVAKTGAPWRDLPSEYGKCSSVHKRFIRWDGKDNRNQSCTVWL